MGIRQERLYTHELAPEIVRAFLVFEYRNGILLRNNQIDSLVELAKKELSAQTVSKQGTGSGKSKVQYPLLQYLRQSVQSILNIWPKALFPRNRDDMQQLAGQSFGQKSETFPFNRQVPLDAPTIMAMNRTLANAIKNKQQINTVAENVQSSELTFLEILYNMSHGKSKPDQELFLALQEMQGLLGKMGHQVDESHIVQDPKKELNFSIGKPASEPVEYLQFISEIFRFLISPEVNSILRLKENMQHLTSEESLRSIASRLTVKMETILKITHEQSASFREYVLNLEAPAPDWIANHPQKQKIALLRGCACQLLKDCFYEKRAGVNYGFSDLNERSGIAIPYAGNNSPIVSSEYEISYETLLKTFHLYLHQKLDPNKSWELVSRMQKMALMESKRFGRKLEETQAYRRFETFRSEEMGNLFEIKPQSADLRILGQNDEFILDYLVLCVAPTVQKYLKKLKSTPQNLRSQFIDMVTMSATPGSHQIYAPQSHYHDDPLASDRKVEQKIKESCAHRSSLHMVATQYCPGKFLPA